MANLPCSRCGSPSGIFVSWDTRIEVFCKECSIKLKQTSKKLIFKEAKMDEKHTARGFKYYEFKDNNGETCSLQESSSAMEPKIWLGVDDANPKIMSSKAIELGLRERTNDERDNGWVKYEVPKDVLMTTRMHLTREQVKELLPYLKKFVKKGEI